MPAPAQHPPTTEPGRDSGASVDGTVQSADGASPATIFTPVHAGRASGAIVRQVQSAILSGQLKVGDRLPPERELAEQFGVSRVTVRDALRVLEANGLVRIRAGAKGGAFVTTPTPAILRDGLANLLILSDFGALDVTEVRLAIEIEVVRLACERADEADLDALERICDRTELAYTTGEYELGMSVEYHVRLAEATHNPVFPVVVEALYGPMLMTLTEAAKEQSIDHRLEPHRYDHRQILDAVKIKDIDTAVAIMTRHLEQQTNRLPRRLQRFQS